MDLTSVAALLVGFFTLLVLLVPLGLSPWVPFYLCVGGLGLTVGDFVLTQGRYTRIFLDWAQEVLDRDQKMRLAYHEGGHLLVGYALGLKALDYAVGVRACQAKGYQASSAVAFDHPVGIGPRAYGITLMAGGVAEDLVFGRAKGGADDLEKLAILLQANPHKAQLEREYVREAIRLLQKNRELHAQLARLMVAQAPLKECLTLLHERLVV
ncbi:hypothetical protein [Anthocerotibacter panamensis]|uniref:hypothetical protein n=1 Tax=Anthocerotibacter panamensis TaxID=2857077 RepID=UPI001C403B9E|nr:hypothetical protein [Anthocerotibacter panamensis]